MSEVNWSKAPVDAQFFSVWSFRKHECGEEYHWVGDAWAETEYETIREHRERASDFQVRPVITPQRTDEVLADDMVAANKVVVDVPNFYNKTSIDFLEEVKAIQTQRAAEYEQDGGERSFDKVATVFNTYTGMELQPSHVALMLEILKNVRFYAQDGYHSDSVVDKISYGSLWAELVTKERT